MLIVVEGVSGAGKTTLVHALASHGRSAGHPVVDLATAEQAADDPAWQLGQLMRTVPTSFPPVEAALLYCARAVGRARLARVHLARQPTALVLSDRLAPSLTVQLQHIADTHTRDQRLDLVTEGLPRTTTILLETNYAEYANRLLARGHRPLPVHEFRSLRNAFRVACRRRSEPLIRIDTSELAISEVVAMALDTARLDLVEGTLPRETHRSDRRPWRRQDRRVVGA